MLLFIPRFLVVLTAMLLAANVMASRPLLIPSPPQIAATSYIMMDAYSGEILVERNADERVDPASLTKLMTSYVADYELQQGNITLSDMVPISVNAWAQNFPGSSVMFLEAGRQVSVEDLLRGISVASGNDASVAIAEHIAGSEGAFVDIMNQHAQLMGLENTRFANSHGLSHPDHYTTARDMARLARARIMEFPDRYSIHSEREFTFNGIRQSNRNRLLWRDSSVDGLKTGYTQSAGYCLVASALRDDMRLITVVMGTRSEEARFQETQKLLSYGFRYYKTLKLYEQAQVVTQTRVWGGESEQVSLVVTEDVYVTVPRSQQDDIKADLSLDKYIQAPVKKGQELGEISLRIGNDVLRNQPVVAHHSVERGGIFTVLWSRIKLFFVKLFSG